MLYKLFSFLEVSILAFVGRGLGILSIPIIALLNIDPLKYSIIPAIFFFVRGLVAFPNGSFIDRFPRFGFLVGGVFFCIGMWWLSYTLTNYNYFLIGVIITSIGATGMAISANTLGIRSEGYGRTWDLIGVGLGHSFAPIFAAVVVSFIFNISLAFKIIGIAGLIVDIIFILTFTNVNVRENRQSSLKVTFNCLKEKGFIRLLIAVVALEIIGLFYYTNFSLALKDVGISEKMSIIFFLLSLGVMGMMLRFPYAYFSNKYGARNIFIMIYCIALIGNTLFVFPYYILKIFGLFLVAFGIAGYSIILTAYIGDRWERKKTASMFGIVVMSTCLTGPLSLLLHGYLRNITGSYTISLLIFNILAIITYIIFLFEKDIIYLDKINGKDYKDE